MASQIQLPFSRAGRSANPYNTYLTLVVLAGLLVGGWPLWLLRNEAEITAEIKPRRQP